MNVSMIAHTRHRSPSLCNSAHLQMRSHLVTFMSSTHQSVGIFTQKQKKLHPFLIILLFFFFFTFFFNFFSTVGRTGGSVVDNTLDYQSMDRKIDPPLLRSFG